MTNRDRAVLGALAAVLGSLALTSILSSSVGQPVDPGSSQSRETTAAPSASTAAGVYHEGVLGRPTSITPLTARTQADRDLVALVYRGLARLGPDGTLLPDLAEGWQVDPTGKTYTFSIRPDARWQDGVPVTATDVAFTVDAIRDPSYKGPLAGSWREVTATVVDDLTVRLTLATPLGGFLQAATLPLLPAHALRDVPIGEFDTSTFSLHPVGNGPYRLLSVDSDRAILEAVPAVLAGSFRPAVPAGSPPPSGQPSASPGVSAPADSSSPTSSPTSAPGSSPASAPGSPIPSLSPSAAAPAQRPGSPPQRIELDFFDDSATLADALRSGRIDAAGGLPPAPATELGSTPGFHLTRYPRSIFSAVVLNLRPSYRQFRIQRVRRALLKAIDRNKLVAMALSETGTVADTPISPASWAFDPKASARIKHDPAGAAVDLKAEGWRKTSAGWFPKGSKTAFAIEIVTPDEASNPIAWSTAQSVAQDWRSIGLTVTVVGLTPSEFVAGRLIKGAFAAAVVDVNVGLDPDLYPLLASTQAGTGGSNVAGVQNPDLDKLLVAARAPGSDATRKKAYSGLETFLARTEIVLPMFFRDYLFVASDRLTGAATRELADPSDRYWDVLDWRLASAR